MSETLEVKIGASDAGLEATLKTVQSELAKLDTKIKGGDLSFKELDQTMRKIAQAEGLEKKLQAMGTASLESSQKIKNLGDSIESTGDKTKKIGGIFDDEFKQMGAAFTIGNLAAEGFQKAISLAFDAARAVVKGFSDALDLGGRLSELSTRTGEAAGTLLVLETAFKNSGLEASQVGVVINKLQNFMQDAANGGEKQTKAMSDLGISMADLAGKTPSEQMDVFAKKIALIEDPTQRAATASEVFGEKLGGKLLPLLVDFSGNIEDARSKVGSLEQVMNENADTFDKFSESIDAVKGKMASFSAGVLSETVPALQDLGSKMEGVDAAGLGKVIGQILNPAIVDLTKNIALAADGFGFLKTAASDVGGGLKNNSEDFKEGATQANKYLQIVAALLPGGLDPLNLALKGIANVSDAATNGMKGVADAASDAKPAVQNLGNEAVGTGEKINTAFTFTADLKPELDSIGTGWKDVGDNIGTSNSLLEGTGNAFGAIAEKTDDQVAGIGGVNDQLAVSGDLSKLLLDLTGKVADKENEAALAAEKKAAQVAEANKLKQSQLSFELEIAAAQATGNQAEIKALEERKAWLDAWKKATESGMGEANANAFADAMLKTKQITDSISGKNIIITVTTTVEDKKWKTLLAEINSETASPHAIEVALSVTGQTDLIEARKILGLMESKNIEVGMKTSGVDSVENLQKILYSLPTQKDVDLAFKLTGKDDFESAAAAVKNLAPTKEVLLTLKEQGFASLKEYKDSIAAIGNGATAEIVAKDMGGSLADVQAAVYAIVESGKKPTEVKVKATADTTAAAASIAELGAKPVNLVAKFDMAAFADSLASLKSAAAAAFNKPLKLNLTDSIPSFGPGTTPMQEPPKPDTSILSELKNLVSDIKTLVGKIEPKLPVASLVA